MFLRFSRLIRYNCLRLVTNVPFPISLPTLFLVLPCPSTTQVSNRTDTTIKVSTYAYSLYSLTCTMYTLQTNYFDNFLSRENEEGPDSFDDDPLYCLGDGWRGLGRENGRFQYSVTFSLSFMRAKVSGLFLSDETFSPFYGSSWRVLPLVLWKNLCNRSRLSFDSLQTSERGRRSNGVSFPCQTTLTSLLFCGSFRVVKLTQGPSVLVDFRLRSDPWVSLF